MYNQQMGHPATPPRNSFTEVLADLNSRVNGNTSPGNGRNSLPLGLSDAMLSCLAENRSRSASAMRTSDVNSGFLAAQGRSMSTGVINPMTDFGPTDFSVLCGISNTADRGVTSFNGYGKHGTNDLDRPERSGVILHTRQQFQQPPQASNSAMQLEYVDTTDSQVVTIAEVLHNTKRTRSNTADMQNASNCKRLNSGGRSVEALLERTESTNTQPQIQAQVQMPIHQQPQAQIQTQAYTQTQAHLQTQTHTPAYTRPQAPQNYIFTASMPMNKYDRDSDVKLNGPSKENAKDTHKLPLGTGNAMNGTSSTSESSPLDETITKLNKLDAIAARVESPVKLNNVNSTRGAAHEVTGGTEKHKSNKCTWKDCSLAFIKSSDLVRHVRTHTKEMPFACTWEGCDKRFSVNGILTRHMRTHTGELPFSCTWEGCEKRCSQNSDLKRHMRVHTAELPYECVWKGCSKKFSTKGNLKRHTRTHTKVR
ncbi:hypothetical protein SARC_05970 [Sphaeroforma arctica JP610]|uniref:C2H2-type domain-containing protein n=1 Tax=Sphaeroforma arctica JP610 TaxID=667725 RepID=A0A0L0G0H6_9EUKA|nr:hypothetical protein SARC_05970 [Sphaeroforma arctica JP610]KNC81713.1 hypothetical protein SARC_05970 [Sphaeroforma arctica JP610]|eukprot:XP_014155615.1 hypothetical protein SARC_05970 [Sphaeroforma arctica JP610]